MPNPPPARAACIDIGSNGIRLVAAEADGTGVRTLLQDRASVRLGQGVFQQGRIDPGTMDAAVAALAAFRKQVARFEPIRMRAVATSAVRDARNRKEFLRRASDEAKVDIEVISGSEEARLVHVAVAQRMAMGQDPWLLVDVGGGSVEVSLGNAQGIQWTESRGMGAVRLLADFEAAGHDSRRARKLIEETVGTLTIPRPEQGVLRGVVATGGNIEELARICGARSQAGIDVVPLSDLSQTLRAMLEMDAADRAQKWDLKRDRADVIVPAGLVYEHVARLAQADSIHVPHVALKDGVLAELFAEAQPSPVTGTAQKAVQSALNVGRHFHFEEPHGVQVQRLAVSLFDQLEALHGMGARDRLLLGTAAILHDVGRHIADRKHHKHSYYLISQSEVAGLSRREVDLVAQVARYHRRAEPSPSHAPYAALGPADRHRVDALSALLRVADALDRQHSARVRKVRCVVGDATLRLVLSTAGDIALEEWAVERKGGLFERVFDMKLKVEAEDNHG